MSYNKTYKHTKNGLVQEKFMFYNVGFSITTSIGTGVDGESPCLIIHDSNLYTDEDSRSERPNEYIIPIDDTNDLKELCKSIKKALKERKKTLIKKKNEKNRF
jgi:hypothetical protein